MRVGKKNEAQSELRRQKVCHKILRKQIKLLVVLCLFYKGINKITGL